VDDNELDTIGEDVFHCHLVHHLGDSFHHVLAREDCSAEAHQVGEAPAVACTFEEFGGDEGDRLRVVELEVPISPAPGYLGGEVPLRS
jgi:hypothetical protein